MLNPMECGGTAATPIDDRPLAEPAGVGLHALHNCGGRRDGPMHSCEALAASLNIPAVRAVRFVHRRNP